MTDTASVTSTPVSAELAPQGPESMVHITPVAASKVNEIRDAEGIEANMALRLRVVGGGCAGFSYDLYFDEATEVDRQKTPASAGRPRHKQGPPGTRLHKP